MVNTATHLSIKELLKITHLLLDHLTMLPRYKVLTDLINKKANSSDCFNIFYIAMTNDIVSRVIRVFDASKRSYSISKLISAWREESDKACTKLGINKKIFSNFETDIKPFRDAYFFHIDESNARLNFIIKEELWDNNNIDRNRLLSCGQKAYSVLLEIYNQNSPEAYETAPTYLGEDLISIFENLKIRTNV